MLSQTIVVDGIPYVLTRAVAKGANLSPDYIASFCRGGLVQAVRHNGMWYVNEASLQNFLADEAQQQAEWKRRLSEQRKHELQIARQASPAGRDPTHSTQVKRPTAYPAAMRFTQLKRRASHLVRASQQIILAVALTGILMSALAPVLPDEQQHLIAAGREKIGDALASFGNIPLAGEQLAAASSFPWLEEFAKNFHAALCPILRNCPSAERAIQPAPRPPSLANKHPPAQTPGAANAATSVHQQSAQPIQPTIVNNPVVERVIERVVETQRLVSSAGGITEEILNARLGELDNKLMSKIYGISSAPGPITYVSTPPSSGGIQNQIALSQRVDSLAEATITDSTFSGGTISGAAISGGSVSGASITGTIAALIDTAVATIDDLTSNTITAINATTTSLYVSATSTHNGIKIASLDCSSLGNGGTLTTDSSGNVVCAADDGGSASVGGSDTHVQFNSSGSFAGSAAFTFSSSTNLLKVGSASSTLLSIFDRIYIGGSGTTTIRGDGAASTIPFASSTALSVSGTGYFSSASTTNLTVSGSPSGLLTTSATGLVSASTTLGLNFGGTGATTASGARTNLGAAASGANSDITSLAGLTTALTVAQGGTGWGNITSGAILYGNGASALATTSAGTAGNVLALLNGVPTWTATSTLSTISGTLGASQGGTGITSPTAAGILLGSYTGGSWQQLATSSLGLAASALAALDFGDWTCNGSTCSLDADTVSDSELDYSAVTLADFTNDADFVTWTAATSTLWRSAGLLSSASSTIGSGTQAGGLTISGGATTTGNAYFAGNVGVGTIAPNASLSLGNSVAAQKLLLYDDGNVRYGFGIQASELRMFTPESAHISFGKVQSSDGLTWTEKVRFDTEFGSVGIGTTSPWGRLAVTGADTSSATNGFLVADSNNSPLIVVKNNGSVGIGTTSPTNRLEVAGNTFLGGTLTATGTLTVSGTGTSTFTGAIESGGYLNITGTSATSTFARGIALSGGCVSVNGTCLGTSNVTNLDSLSDTTITSAGYGDLLMHNGSAWVETATSSLFSTSQQLAAWLSDESGTGNAAFTTSPSFTTPTLGVATATTLDTGQGANELYDMDQNVLTTSDVRFATLLSTGSSTIGNGTAGGGLTIFGTATTTNYLVVQGSGTSTFTGALESGAYLNITGTSATSTFARGINLAGGCFSINGTCVGGGGSGDITAVGSMTSGDAFAGTGADDDWLGLGSAAGRIAFDDQSTDYVNILDANVGIGTTSPWAKLSVNHFSSGASTMPLFVVASSTGSGATSTAFFINHLGNVGIGATSPIAPLSVVGGNSSTLTLTRHSVDAVAGNTAAAIDFRIDQEDTGTATGDAFQARIESRPQDAWGGSLAFYTKPADGNSTGSLTERMRILYDGNVGIGTTSPWAKLSVNQFNGGTTPLFVVASSTGAGATSTALMIDYLGNVGIGTAGPAMKLDVQTGHADGIRLSDSNNENKAWLLNNTNAGELRLYADNDSLSAYVNSSGNSYLNGGNVGIGTTSPLAQLDVVGNVALSGTSPRYINFNATSSSSVGADGYGFRDSGGTLEFKNAAGTWRSITTATSGPSFSVHKNGTNQTVTTGVFTLLTWSTERFDTNNNFDLSTERFTPTVPGKYVISLLVNGNAGGADNCLSQIYRNGSIYQGRTNGGLEYGSELTTILDMNGTTDYLEAFVHCGFGTSVAGNAASTTFSGALIAPTAAVSGVWSISDQRLKENVATTSFGLDLLALIPVHDFNLIGDADHRQQGFIAQELYKYYPDAVEVGGDNVFLDPWLVDYGRLTPLLAKAIQDLNLKLEGLATAPATSTASTTPTTFASQFFQNLFTRITKWLADAANGIANIISDTLTARQRLCVGSTCVTEDQFIAVFGNSQSAAAGAPTLGGKPEAPSGAPAREATPATGTATSTTPSDYAPITNTTPQAAAGASPIEQSNSTGQASGADAREAPDGLPAPGAVGADTATTTTSASPTAVPEGTSPIPQQPTTSDAAAQESTEDQTQIVAEEPSPTEPPPLPPAANDNPPPPSAEAI